MQGAWLDLGREMVLVMAGHSEEHDGGWWKLKQVVALAVVWCMGRPWRVLMEVVFGLAAA